MRSLTVEIRAQLNHRYRTPQHLYNPLDVERYFSEVMAHTAMNMTARGIGGAAKAKAVIKALSGAWENRPDIVIEGFLGQKLSFSLVVHEGAESATITISTWTALDSMREAVDAKT